MGNSLVPKGSQIGAALYELDPGDYVVYHAHHGSEQLLIVLRGRPTLRTPGRRAAYPGTASDGSTTARLSITPPDRRVRTVCATTPIRPFATS